VEVFRKDFFGRWGTSPSQTEALANVSMSYASSGEPLVNAAPLYDTQGVLQVGDFDFDGRDDFAVQVGNDGPYGGPTFDVYLDSPLQGRFVRSEALSELTRTKLGMFLVDPGRKHLLTFAKSGCCWHETGVYEVARGTPVLVGSLTEDATATESPEVVVTESRLAGGRWRRTVERHPLDP
jgi:hypothetical protein